MNAVIQHRRTKTQSSGSILIAVMVCMGVALTIVMGVVVSGLQARRQIRHEAQLQQTEWLLEAGVLRAVKRSREDDEYVGETWQVSPALSQHQRAEVVIQVDDPSNQSRRFKIVARIQGTSPIDKVTQRSAEISLQRKPISDLPES